MKDQQQQDEQNQIRLYEIMRGELDTPYVAEASLDNTPHNPECCGETKFDEHGFYLSHIKLND